MEQAREEAHQQQNQLQIPLKCPRCGSLDTRFRYFNNYSLSQPRRHCRTCRRQWTVGGKLRLIPIGGNTRNGKQTKASSSKGSDSSPQPTQPPLSLGEGHQQQLTLMTAKVSQNFDRTLLQPMTNMPEFIWAPQQATSQQNSVTYEPYQTHTEATSAPPSHLNNSGVQPEWPMNFLLQDIGYDSSFTIPNACLQNNLSCDTTDAEDTTYVNVDEWLNLQGV